MTAKALAYMKWGFVLLFVNINIGRIDLLPGFLGLFLLLQGLRSQEMTETERRICPLLWVLIVDYFLHWIFVFDYVPENLIIEVISTYTIYILLGEIGRRVADTRPEQAKSLHYIRIALTTLTVLGYLVGAYEHETSIVLISGGTVIVLITLLVVLFKIKPVDAQEEEC